MDLVSGNPFWPLKNGLLTSYPTLDESISCDVVILGAGITGALAAHHLTEAGVSVVVLDQRDVAQGSTAASTSLLQYEIDVPLHRLMKLVGEKHAVRAYKRCLSALTSLRKLDRSLGDAGGWTATESLLGASQADHVPGLRREAAARERHGFKVELWSRRRIRSESDLPYPAALVSRDAGHIDAYRLTHALLESAAARGARIHDRTRVVRRRPSRTGVTLETATGHRVSASRLVVATGYETEPYLKDGLAQLVSTYALVTEPLSRLQGWPGKRLIWETARPYAYLRPTTDHRVIIGGYDEPFRDPARRDALLKRKQALLERRLRQLLPSLKAETAYAWTGTFAETPDGLPYIGTHPNVHRTFFALGYGGNGITYSLIAAEIFRDLYCEGTCRDADLFSFNRHHP
jgi:glycine/D-amino acid oxidase-like deaminating enzyme